MTRQIPENQAVLIMNQAHSSFKSIYGPVQSWRFGRSLGVDVIGPRSTCSFNCAYCQLGDIQQKTTHRQVFVDTNQIRQELSELDPLTKIDVITLSGSGEPTLALNLDEILASVKKCLDRPVVVLTNGSLLRDKAVCSALQLADQVIVKLDAISNQQLQCINRPEPEINLALLLEGISTFSKEYSGHLAIQTMLLRPWPSGDLAHYIQLLKEFMPDEVQLNAPSRPRVLTRQLEARGNQILALEPNAFQKLKCVSTETLKGFSVEIEAYSGISTRYPLLSV
ncbi:MAG: radical SAM protein [Leptolyngbyaceae cyanobacterium]